MTRRAYRWQGWRIDLQGGTIRSREGSPTTRKKPKGITNEQAKLLAKLQRKAGEPYSGRGLSVEEADREIKRLVRSRPNRTQGGS